MYPESFGTDWRRLDEDEAVRRMYALGVAAALGEALPEERARVRSFARTTYERSLLDLAYDEGHAKASGYRGQDGDTWEELVGDDVPTSTIASAAVGPVRPARAAERLPDGIPGAVARAEFLELTVEDLSRLDLPGFLRGDSAD